jgi:predicted transcriptional regulator
LSNEAFTLLVVLKNIDRKNINYVRIYREKLMSYLNWTNSRKLKKYLQELLDSGYIIDKVEPRHKPLEITLTKTANNHFTQLPYSVLYYLNDIKETGVRLLYYYCCFQNGKDDEQDYTFTSYETINKDTGISKATAVKYNKILVEKGLLFIEQNQLERCTNINTGKEYIKFNNYYHIKYNKLKDIDQFKSA